MATFTYEALNSGGQEVKAELEAPSKEEAVAKIRGLGYFPTKITEKGAKKKVSAKRSGTSGHPSRSSFHRRFLGISQRPSTKARKISSRLRVSASRCDGP